jgi:hypothetical protein
MTTAQTASATTDFEDYFLQDTAEIFLKLPNKQPMLYQGYPVSITLYGPTTDQYSAAKAELNKEASRRVMASMGSATPGQEPESDPKADAELDARYLAALTVSVNNFPFPGGALAIYREPKLLYVPTQVRAFLNSLGNFFKAGSAA